MKSIVYTRHGSPDVLHLVERALPEPGAGEVRVRVVVSGVNPTDWKKRVGAGDGAATEAKSVPNQDGAGVVDAIGDGVEGLAVGDRVWIYLAAHERAGWGTVLAAEVSFDVGASLGVPAVTAHRALTVAEAWPARLSPGSLSGATVLVSGGAGAVGHAAIQLARWAGATVITTVSSDEKAALATAAGAHHVVNYRTGDARREILEIAPDGVDIAVEVAPAENNPLDVAVVRNHGTISIYANNGGETFEIDVRATFSRNLRYQFLLLYTLDAALVRAAAEDINAAVAAGALRVGAEAGVPLHHFPLEETAAAHDAVEAGTVGKVLVDIG
jgi:NADPH2:quinone reductase